MGFLRVLFFLMLISGCEFHPGLKDSGYPECNRDSDCPYEGLVCLEGICIADCARAEPVVWIASETEGPGRLICSPEASCQQKERWELQLPVDSYCEVGPEDGQDEPRCSLMLAHLSLVLQEEAEPASLGVTILGSGEPGHEVVGVVPDPIELDQPHQSMQYVINPQTFAWPVRVRLNALGPDGPAHLVLEEYRLLCCR